MIKQQVLARAKNVLGEFYATNKEKGILGIYLWGSITTNDFDPKKSDIDSVAFVDENVPIKNEAKAIKTVSKQLPGLSMRFVYVSEMHGGKPKGNLAKVADYRLLAVDLPYWKHVVGRKFTLKNLGIKAVNNKAVIKLTLHQIRTRNLLEIKQQKDKEKYFVKAMMRLCFYIQKKSRQSGSFSYSRVKKGMNNKTRKVVDTLFEIKESGYDKKTLDEKLSTLLPFLRNS